MVLVKIYGEQDVCMMCKLDNHQFTFLTNKQEAVVLQTLHMTIGLNLFLLTINRFFNR